MVATPHTHEDLATKADVDARFDRVEERLDRVEERLLTLENTVTNLTSTVASMLNVIMRQDDRPAAVDKRLDENHRKMLQILERIENNINRQTGV